MDKPQHARQRDVWHGGPIEYYFSRERTRRLLIRGYLRQGYSAAKIAKTFKVSNALVHLIGRLPPANWATPIALRYQLSLAPVLGFPDLPRLDKQKLGYLQACAGMLETLIRKPPCRVELSPRLRALTLEMA